MKYSSLLLLAFSFGLESFGQITAVDIPYLNFGHDMNVQYEKNGTLTHTEINNRDTGTNYYQSPSIINNAYLPFFIRKNNEWLLKIRWVFESYSGYYHGLKLVEPAVSNENDPPCFGKWEEIHQTNGTPLGVFHYITLTGTCSNVNNASPPPTLSVVMTPTGLNLPQLGNSDISVIPNPQPGQMVWSTDDNCVKVYNGTAWNCL